MSQTSSELFKKIRGQYPQIRMGNADAQTVNDPDQAVFFEFDFTVEGADYGSVELRLGQDDVLYVYFDDSITEHMNRKHRKRWYEFLRDMRQFANRNMLNFEVKNISQSRLNKSDYKYLSNFEQEQTMESKMYGSKKKSYQKINDAKIIVQHGRTVDEEKMGSRTRNIKAIYIENSDGERFKFPNTYLPAARSMARHISEGGYPNDERGSHISEIMQEMLELQGFVRKARGSKYQTEDAQEVISAARDRYTALKDTMNSLKSPRGYRTYFENFAPDVIEVDENDIEDVRRKLTREVFDDRLETGLGAVGKAMKMRTTTTEAKSDSDFFNFRKWKKAAEAGGATVVGDERSGAKATLNGQEVGGWEWDETEKKDPGYGWIEMDMDDEGGFFDYRASDFEVPSTLTLAPGKNARMGITAKDPKAIWTTVMMDIAKRAEDDAVVNFASRMAELIGSIGTTFGPDINDPSVKQDMKKAKDLVALYMNAEHTNESRRVPEFESFEADMEEAYVGAPDYNPAMGGYDDMVHFEIDNEEAYDAVMNQLGDRIDWDEHGHMVADETTFNRADEICYKYGCAAEEVGSMKEGPMQGPTKYGVFSKGGSIGSKNDKPVSVHDSKEEAQAKAKRMRADLSPGERKYYKMSYTVRPIKEEPNEGNEFTHALKKARDSGDDEFEVDGKTYKTESDDLSWIKKLAGINEHSKVDLGYEITPRSIVARQMRNNK